MTTPEQRWSRLLAEQQAARAGEPAWLAAARKAAASRFAELGFPHRKHEEWKYTNAGRIAAVEWSPAPEASLSRADLDALELPLDAGPRVVFTNGRFDPAASSLDGLDPAITVAPLRDALASDPAALEALLGSLGPLDDRAFAQLAAAAFEDGAWVHVPADHQAEQPLFVLFANAPGPEPSVSHPRLLVEAERNSQALVIEVHVSRGAGPHLANSLARVAVGENAHVAHVVLGDEGEAATHLASTHASVARSGRYTSHSVSLGAAIARNDLVVELDAEGAEATLLGLYVAGDGQHVDNQTTVDHRRPHGSSRELYKGVLAGKSRGVFNGKVIVREQAQKTDAQQKNENLLLSGEAEVDSKPQLEIYADDVKCSHGSTIGQLDPDALFYLRARGLGREEAGALLIRGFAAGVTSRLPHPALREAVEARVVERLAGATR